MYVSLTHNSFILTINDRFIVSSNITIPSEPSPATHVSVLAMISQETILVPTVKKTYNVVLTKGESGWIVVKVPELRGLNTQGRTEDEAIKNAIVAIELMLEELGQEKEFNLNIQRKLSA